MTKPPRWLWIPALLSLTALALAGPGCCTSESPPVAPVAGDGRSPAAQARAAAEVHHACVSEDGRVSLGFGSGVLVDETLVLTAGHVVKCDAKESAIIVKFPEPVGDRAARVSVVDHDGDIAVLTLEEAVKLAPAKVGRRPRVDQRICLVTGIPSRERRCGDVQRWEEPPGDTRHDAVTEPGNSGSGVYDGAGRLVGIVTHYVTCRNGQICGGLFTALEGRPWAVAR